jgi:abortive infection bacteriophage resistance protein
VFDKPFKTLDEQIELLKSRKLIIQDEEYAKSILITTSYYTLINSYKSIFCENDVFKDGIKFNDLVMYNHFEYDVQMLIFKQLLSLENSFKTKTSYVLSQQFGVHQKQYLDPQNFHNRNGKLLSKLNFINEIIENDENYPIIHYRLNKNHIPAWILMRNMTFGQVLIFYTQFNNHTKSEIEKYFPEILSPVTIYLGVIKSFRNKIAHGTPITLFQADTSLTYDSIPTEIKTYYNISKTKFRKKGLGKNDLLSLLISLLILNNDKMEKYAFLLEFRELLNRYNIENLLPTNIKQILCVNSIDFLIKTFTND